MCGLKRQISKSGMSAVLKNQISTHQRRLCSDVPNMQHRNVGKRTAKPLVDGSNLSVLTSERPLGVFVLMESPMGMIFKTPYSVRAHMREKHFTDFPHENLLISIRRVSKRRNSVASARSPGTARQGRCMGKPAALDTPSICRQATP
jgi:hypothetical protein